MKLYGTNIVTQITRGDGKKVLIFCFLDDCITLITMRKVKDEIANMGIII